MHSTNYRETLITVSADCSAASGTIPAKPQSIGGLQYALLAEAPYTMTSDDLLFAVHATRNAIAPEMQDAERAAFFAKPQACLRASPLVKTLGWALHHDAQGRVALIDPTSPRHAELLADDSVVKRPGMRSKRA